MTKYKHGERDPNLAEFLNIVEAADRLGCNERTIRRYVADGRLRAWRLGPRMVRIERAEVDALLTPITTAS